eukprot:scaffold1353_cov161-Amphora_coffeaeformis.AAC.28
MIRFNNVLVIILVLWASSCQSFVPPPTLSASSSWRQQQQWLTPTTTTTTQQPRSIFGTVLEASDSKDEDGMKPTTKMTLEEKMKSWEATEEEVKAATLGGLVPGGNNRSDAFDVGLYIAFPLMVLSGLAFAFFPLIMGNLDVDGVGPPPTMKRQAEADPDYLFAYTMMCYEDDNSNTSKNNELHNITNASAAIKMHRTKLHDSNRMYLSSSSSSSLKRRVVIHLCACLGAAQTSCVAHSKLSTPALSCTLHGGFVRLEENLNDETRVSRSSSSCCQSPCKPISVEAE